ncbi:2-amino-4-hydroxy-6-hydroxymethyldihydropteridine diphosphokinase [Solibacillus sp. CAU 1738]|uniref:2-amino-4-hydroxy-6- hydroxymethyldihydropteridine diphosphokinase n=1 Tax=Solibacillus sp. CAU 1738 TaxID=3140363 RepID=UPI00326000CD
MNDVFLSIGTNIGERENNLKQAVRLLQHQFEVINVSSIYETAPVGYLDQPSFLNIAVHVKTSKSPFDTLFTCQAIENELGRVRDIRWGPRIIDLDILLYNHENIEAENLIVPHPRMYERAFVLVPLVEIAPNFACEQLAQARQKLDTLDREKEGITQWKTIATVDEFVRSES